MNNNLSIPDPVITLKPLEANTEKNGKYFSEFEMNIESQIQIPNLYLQVNVASLISFDIIPQRSGMAMSDHSGTREGFAFTNIQQAYGKYRLRVTTEKPEEISLEGNIG